VTLFTMSPATLTAQAAGVVLVMVGVAPTGARYLRTAYLRSEPATDMLHLTLQASSIIEPMPRSKSGKEDLDRGIGSLLQPNHNPQASH